MKKFIKLFPLMIVLALAGMSCSDDAPSAGEPPSIPDLTAVQPSFDYFQANKVARKAMGENFEMARALTEAVELLMISFSSLPEGFLNTAESVEPTFSDGVWTWTYSDSGQGTSVEIRLTAEETNTRINWEMFLTVSSPEFNLDNHKFIDGYIVKESEEGEWNIYDFYGESMSPVMTFSWNITSEDVAEFSVSFNDASFSQIQYTRNTPDNTLTITEDQGTTVIYWNTDNGTGYIEYTGQDRICWDAAGNNVACTS